MAQTPPTGHLPVPTTVAMLVRNVARVLSDVTRFAFATRRVSLLLAILVGFVLVAAALTVQFAAPLAIYPFV